MISQRLHLFRCQGACGAPGHSAQLDGADSHARETLDWMAKRQHGATDLALLSLAQRKGEHAGVLVRVVAKPADPGRRSQAVFETDTPLELVAVRQAQGRERKEGAAPKGCPLVSQRHAVALAGVPPSPGRRVSSSSVRFVFSRPLAANR